MGLYDDAGRPDGTAPRSVMRAQNLRHGATGVVVRDGLGRFFVHRRTDTKDVYPGHYDFTAGGVLQAGEEPLAAARRELAEELGIDAPLVPLGEDDYADEHTRYHAFLYRTQWDGPVRLQPEEVASGEWLTLEALLSMLDDPAVPMMPDAAGLLGDWLRQRATLTREPEQGWDSNAVVVEETWLDRTPRRPEVAASLRAECWLLPEIADRLSLTVPRPVILDEEPLRVRHLLVPGEPVGSAGLTAADGVAVGRFLRELHAIEPGEAISAGVPGAVAARAELEATVADFSHRVVPLLPRERRVEAARLLAEAIRTDPHDRLRPALIHGDLGPQHLLRTTPRGTGGRVTGVIDWTDARVADPAIDLAWVLNGTAAPFAHALADAYGVSEELRRRADVRHRLGPWWEVTAGLDHLGPDYVESGLHGVLDRL